MNVIISGASKGIGYQTALHFAKKGCQVLAIARTHSRLETLKAEDSKIMTLAIDLLDTTLSQELDARISSWSQVDVLVNNAGQLINSPLDDCSLEDFENQFRANVLTAVNLVRATNKKLVSGSHIVNISSMGGFQGSSKFKGLAAYSTSKAALNCLSECMAEEYKSRGVKVNALALGAVQTEMLKKAFPDYQPPIDAQTMGKYIVDFALSGGTYYNGKVLPVALENP